MAKNQIRINENSRLKRFSLFSSISSVALLVVLASNTSIRTSIIPKTLANISVLLMVVAAISLYISTYKTEKQSSAVNTEVSGDFTKTRYAATILLSGAISLLIGQARFVTGTVLAFGDLQPPEGMAWISHLFSPWTWSGTNLGGPSNLQLQLPWAIALETIHFFGGSAALVQRVWFSILLAAIAGAATALLLVLESGRLSAIMGGLIYALSPYFFSNSITLSPIWLSATALVPAILAFFILISRFEKLPRWWWLMPAITAPMLGYCFQTPPAAGIVLLSILISPLFITLLYGKITGKVALKHLFLVLIVTIPLCLYWIVPAVIQLHLSSVSNILANGSWTGNENRAVLANSLWMVTTPYWHLQFAYSYSSNYSQYPLSLLRYFPAITAFVAVLIAGLESFITERRRRQIAITALVACIILIFSTGTNFPGWLIFNPIYKLPYGWLLQYPNHFLFLAALAYAILIASVLDSTFKLLISRFRSPSWTKSNQRHKNQLTKHFGMRFFADLGIIVFALTWVTALFLPSLPIFTGSVVANHDYPNLKFPSVHTVYPKYWTALSNYLNSVAPAGNVVVLPPYSYYEVPRTWYYGNVGFVTAAIKRNVLYAPGEPGVGGYFKYNAAVEQLIETLTQNIVARNSRETKDLLQTIGSPFILVAGDVQSPFPGRNLGNIYSPRRLEQGLRLLSGASLVFKSGPLQLYRIDINQLSSTANTPPIVTTTSTTPDLQVLQALPMQTAIVTSRAIAGLDAITYFPPDAGATPLTSSSLQEAVQVPSGRDYSVALLDSGASRAGITNKFFPVGAKDSPIPGTNGAVRGFVTTSGSRTFVNLDLRANQIYSGQALNKNDWTFSNCADSAGNAGLAYSLTNEGPSASPSYSLTSKAGSACISRQITRLTGLTRATYRISILVRDVQGAYPRVCLWSTGQNSCISGSKIFKVGARWTKEVFTVSTNGSAGKISFYMYADSPLLGRQFGENIPSAGTTVSQYSNLHIEELPPSQPVVLSSVPPNHGLPLPVLRTQTASFSPGWTTSSSDRHVLVDGLVNGWLHSASPTSLMSKPTSISYWPTRIIWLAGILSLLSYIWVFTASIFFNRHRLAVAVLKPWTNDRFFRASKRTHGTF